MLSFSNPTRLQSGAEEPGAAGGAAPAPPPAGTPGAAGAALVHPELSSRGASRGPQDPARGAGRASNICKQTGRSSWRHQTPERPGAPPRRELERSEA